MTRHFLRDKNGEEVEIPSRKYSTLEHGHMWIPLCKDIKILAGVKRKEILINNKLEFIVWQEV